MKPRVLIVCTGNSCRSQMAEGLLRHFSSGTVEVSSAGTHHSFVHPLAIRVMGELGIDISHHRSKSVDEFINQQFDFVITVCDDARDVCPVFPGPHRTFHFPFEDPIRYEGDEEKRMQHFRRIRDQIAETMKDFVTKLSVTKT